MAIGDNWNDRENVAYAGLPVVMGNSIAELKTLGYATTLNDDAGVAAAIRKYAGDKAERPSAWYNSYSRDAQPYYRPLAFHRGGTFSA